MPTIDPLPPPIPAGDRLDSWKDIAAYLKRSVSTVQRWEQEEALPVRRHQHGQLGSIYASRAELDAWWEARRPALHHHDDDEAEVAEEPAPAPSPAPAGRRRGRRLTILALVVVGGMIAAGHLYFLRHARALTPLRITSLAVLPLANMTGDPGQEYFADGMTDALITELSRISALRVSSRTSVMQYKAARSGLPQVARQLGVDAVVEGSVLRAGDRVRITATLIAASSDKHLWAETYDRDARDVLTLQKEVARAVADQVNAKLTPREATHLATARPINPAVYEEYLQGRFYWNKRSGADVSKAILYFQRAVEIDPGYALGYAGLADAFQLLPEYGGMRPRDAFPKAKAAAEKAIAIDGTLAEGHCSLAYIKALYDHDWVGAEQEFRRAIDLDPRSAMAHHWYGWMLLRLGRFDQAKSELERARALDPLSLPIKTSLGTLLLLTRHYDEAIAQYREVLEMDPDFVQAHDYLGNAYLLSGMPDRAIAEFQEAEAASGGMTRSAAGLGRAYAAAGKRDQARMVLAQLTAQSRREYVSWYELALLYTALGEKDQAFSSLDRSCEERDTRLSELKVGPQVDPLRADPRFQVLLRRTNLLR